MNAMDTTPVATLLVVDDTPKSVKLLADLLTVKGYRILTAASGPEALAKIEQAAPDLVLLDVLMPGMDGHEVCRRIRANPATAVLPVVMVTALDPAEERVKGLEAGADDFLSKPINRAELLARVRSLLRIKTLFDTVQEQTRELECWNRTLEQQVQTQVRQIERLGRLRRFLAPQVAELVLSAQERDYLSTHRRLIAALFCDLRGFTAFAETVEPEELVEVLRDYHDALGTLIDHFGATIDHRAGDGLMVFFNDPLPCSQPALQAVRMAVAARAQVEALRQGWRRRGYRLGFGVGIALGYATIGLFGFSGRYDYSATGRVVNLASRLCDQADDGQILISRSAYAELADAVDAEFVADLDIKGFRQPVPVFNIQRLHDPVRLEALEAAPV